MKEDVINRNLVYVAWKKIMKYFMIEDVTDPYPLLTFRNISLDNKRIIFSFARKGKVKQQLK